MGQLNSCFEKAGGGESCEGGEKGQQQPQYSWDKAKKEDMSKYIIENVNGGEVGRAPGEINGETTRIFSGLDLLLPLNRGQR